MLEPGETTGTLAAPPRLIVIRFLFVLVMVLCLSESARSQIVTGVETEYGFPVAEASAASLGLHVDETTFTLTGARPHLLVPLRVRFRARGVLWQVYGDERDQIIVECVGSCEGAIKTPWAVSAETRRDEIDSGKQNPFPEGLERQSIGVVFSDDSITTESIRQHYTTRRGAFP